jgi:hypothetical protein
MVTLTGSRPEALELVFPATPSTQPAYSVGSQLQQVVVQTFVGVP